MKLAEHKPFASSVITDHPHIFVYLAGLVHLLSRISGLVPDLEKLAAQNEPILSFNGAMTRFAGLVATPCPNEEAQRSKRVRTRRGLLRENGNTCSNRQARKADAANHARNSSRDFPDVTADSCAA
jgi:hypothetical protein